MRVAAVVVVLVTAACGIAAWAWLRGPSLSDAPKASPISNAELTSAASTTKGLSGQIEAANAVVTSAVETAELQIDDAADAQSAELMSLDPRLDGWEIEHFNDLANKQLKGIGRLIEAESLDARAVANFVTEDYFSSPLAPRDPASVYRRGTLQVVRGDQPAPGEIYRGQAGFAAALAELTKPLTGADHPHVKFKVTRVTPSADYVETQQLYSASGISAHGAVEQHALWTIRWTMPGDDALPRITHVEWRDFQQSTDPSAKHALFTDCTGAVFAELPRDVLTQITTGVDRWVQRIEYYLEAYQFGHNGIAVGDVNGDGLEDVYRCQMGGLPNRLWLANEDGTVREASAEAGVDLLDNTRGALLVDLDNDGDQDLAVALPRSILILENDGSGKFEGAATIRGINHAFSLSAADYDQDADLDLYACVYFAEKATAAELPVPMPIYDARNGGRNPLIRNDGDWKFTDVTSEVGLDDDNSRFSYAAVWEDFDNDGDLDLFVANDFGTNDYYENEHGRFREVSEERDLVDNAFGMSAAAADYDRDGWVDIYKANMFSSAGNRVTHASQFMPAASERHKDRFRHLARGNTLFHNRGGQFEDVSVESGAMQGRWSWGSMFLDVNNDGWEDLFVANGFMTGADIDDL